MSVIVFFLPSNTPHFCTIIQGFNKIIFYKNQKAQYLKPICPLSIKGKNPTKRVKK